MAHHPFPLRRRLAHFRCPGITRVSQACPEPAKDSWHLSPHIPRSLWTPADPPSTHLFLGALCIGFWPVNTIAICFWDFRPLLALSRLFQDLGECGLPCELRGSLCTLQLFRSVLFTSCTTFLTTATLGMGGWLALTQQGPSPCKKRQVRLAH